LRSSSIWQIFEGSWSTVGTTYSLNNEQDAQGTPSKDLNPKNAKPGETGQGMAASGVP